MRRWTMMALLGIWLLIAPAAVMLAEPTSAQADPDATLLATPGELTLSWVQLGLPRGVDFPTTNVNQDFAVPLPTGFRPNRLRGLIHAPVNISGGYLEIDDDRGAFLGAVNFPAAQTADQVVVPFDIDIAAAHTGDSTVGLSFTVRHTNAPYENCGPQQTLSITDLATVFAGAEPAPTSIATFFPSVLQRVVLYAPTDADSSEQQAVLTLAAALTRAYRPQTVVITVAEQPRGATPPPAGPLARAVLVERGAAGLEIAGAGTPEALLRVSGRDDQLVTQVSVLANRVQDLAQTPRARVDQAGSRRGATTDTMTFDQLQMTGKADVLRTATLTVGADRAALSDGRIDNIRVHLLADYTPVAKEDSATVMVRAGSTVVFTSALNDSGRLDATFDLPAQVLTERIVLNFALTYTPRMICSPMIAPITFQLDPRSTLTVHRGGLAVGGFRSLPSEFSPHFVVALDGSGPGQLSYAARLVVDMARVTSAELTPRVVDLKSALESKLGALIVANSTTLKQTTLNPPVSGDQSSISLDLPTVLRADVGSGLGSIQAFADPPRDRTVLLVTTTAAWQLVEPLFGYIEQLPDGWSQLTGDTLAAGAQGIPADMSIRDNRIAPASSRGSSTPPLSVVFGILGAFVLGVFAAWLWLRRRSGQPAARSND
ncbi:hypothetical protein [Mycobacterium sp. EPa45]|uniref:hypothetical protein n=1 Tax=Mycobacterium sp. EPa45 TaxID=1545728 RepID=UPI000641BDAD|nr:hypothetical protein [Mycobacterium sp. EPa45]AKK29100.1 hypothetical protein AB431_23205 [Mycobacterium sp. EPa45]